MVRLFIRHPVADYTAWRQVYDGFDEERRGMGVTGHAVYQSVDDPNDVTAWHDFETREQAESFASSDRLREAMTEAGVEGQPSIWFGTEATYPAARRLRVKTRRAQVEVEYVEAEGRRRNGRDVRRGPGGRRGQPGGPSPTPGARRDRRR